MTANPGGGDYRPDARPSGMWPSNAIDRATGRRPTAYTPPEDVVYPDRETGTDGMTNLEGELAQLRAEVERLTAITKAQGQNVSWMSYHDAMARGDALSRRALKAEAALTRVRALVKPQWRNSLYDRNALIDDIRAALDGPVTSATSPSPASTGDTGTPGGSAPSDSPSEAQSASCGCSTNPDRHFKTTDGDPGGCYCDCADFGYDGCEHGSA